MYLFTRLTYAKPIGGHTFKGPKKKLTRRKDTCTDPLIKKGPFSALGGRGGSPMPIYAEPDQQSFSTYVRGHGEYMYRVAKALGPDQRRSALL